MCARGGITGPDILTALPLRTYRLELLPFAGALRRRLRFEPGTRR